MCNCRSNYGKDQGSTARIKDRVVVMKTLLDWRTLRVQLAVPRMFLFFCMFLLFCKRGKFPCLIRTWASKLEISIKSTRIHWRTSNEIRYMMIWEIWEIWERRRAASRTTKVSFENLRKKLWTDITAFLYRYIGVWTKSWSRWQAGHSVLPFSTTDRWRECLTTRVPSRKTCPSWFGGKAHKESSSRKHNQKAPEDMSFIREKTSNWKRENTRFCTSKFKS